MLPKCVRHAVWFGFHYFGRLLLPHLFSWIGTTLSLFSSCHKDYPAHGLLSDLPRKSEREVQMRRPDRAIVSTEPFEAVLMCRLEAFSGILFLRAIPERIH